MINYQIIIEESARLDLISVIDYIIDVFQEPLIAFKMQESIVNEIISLERFPKRAKALEDEPFKSMGYRVTYVKNYSIFYKVIDESQEVRVMRILYNRREWQDLL